MVNDKLKEIELIRAELAEIDRKEDEIRKGEPFWFFESGSGDLKEVDKVFLRRYLKEADLPVRVDSQLDVLRSRAEIRGVSGGNRSGKTAVGVVDGIIKSTGELPISLRTYEKEFEEVIRRAKSKVVKGRVTAVDNKQLHRVVLDLWRRYVPKNYLKGSSWEGSYSKEFDVLTLYRGGKQCAVIEFLTNEQSVKSSQGSELDWAKFDEEPDKDKYKETLMRFGTSEVLDIEIDWTPTEGLTWATDLFHYGIYDEKEVKESRELFKLTPIKNPAISKDTLAKIMDAYKAVESYDSLKMRLLGEAVSLSGLIYSGLFSKAVHVIKPFKVTHDDYIVYRGLDPHLVKPTVCVEIALDKEGHEYVIGTYVRAADTEVIKSDLVQRVKEKEYRLGWTRCDKSADSTLKAIGDRNIFQELGRGKNAIPALEISEKFTGSIHAGVDTIKQLLKPNEITNKPKLYIFDLPENQTLIQAMLTIERDTYTNEDKKGLKDRINEGRHDTHAALRYPHQRIMRWLPPMKQTFHYVPDNAVVGY